MSRLPNGRGVVSRCPLDLRTSHNHDQTQPTISSSWSLTLLRLPARPSAKAQPVASRGPDTQQLYHSSSCHGDWPLTSDQFACFGATQTSGPSSHQGANCPWRLLGFRSFVCHFRPLVACNCRRRMPDNRILFLFFSGCQRDDKKTTPKVTQAETQASE